LKPIVRQAWKLHIYREEYFHGVRILNISLPSILSKSVRKQKVNIKVIIRPNMQLKSTKLNQEQTGLTKVPVGPSHPVHKRIT
jgi:hypothetical protein